MAYNLLKGKRGIITGALDENSINWQKKQNQKLFLLMLPV